AKFSAAVSADGSGTHTNIQSAIAAAPDDATNTFSILIKSGTYQGPIVVPKTKKHIKLIGEELATTILTYPFNVHEAPAGVTTPFNPGLFVASDDFKAENL